MLNIFLHGLKENGNIKRNKKKQERRNKCCKRKLADIDSKNAQT